MKRKEKPLDKLDEIDLGKLSGTRLRAARVNKKLRRRDVVQRMAHVWGNTEFVTRLQSYEAGTRAMSIHTARHLGHVLDVSAAWLMCVMTP